MPNQFAHKCRENISGLYCGPSNRLADHPSCQSTGGRTAELAGPPPRLRVGARDRPSRLRGAPAVVVLVVVLLVLLVVVVVLLVVVVGQRLH